MGVSLSISLPLAIVSSGSQMPKTRISKVSIAIAESKVSISVGSRVRVTRIAEAITGVSRVSSVGGSKVLGVSLGLSISLPLAIIALGHRVKPLGDGVQSRAGSKGDSGMGVTHMAKTRVAITKAGIASIAKSSIAIASIRMASIAKLSLS